MSARSCSACGGTGHYAKTCARRTATASTPDAPREAPAPKPRREAVKRRAQAVAGHLAARAAADAEREAYRVATHPYNHVLRERSTTDEGAPTGFLWRHTWVHDATGERIVVTVPMPPSGPCGTAEGLIVLRRVTGVEQAMSRMFSARAEVFSREGECIAVYGYEEEAAAKPVAPLSCGTVSSMTYGEGML